jgi:hypothetical protein
MNEVLLRPIFRAKYIEEQKKNKFNKGGLASIQKFAEGGLSKGERTAITLAPFVQALTGAQTMPGESEASSFARAFGQGLGGLGEAKKSIAAIDAAGAKGDKFRDIGETERINRGLPPGTYQENITTGELKNLTKQKLFESTTEKELGKGKAETIINTQKSGSEAAKNQSTLEIIETVLQNPDMTFGAFANLSEGTQRFFEGLGFGETGFTDLTGVEVLRKFAGQKVLSDLGQLKGALSEKELKFIQDLNISQEMTKEAALMVVSLYKKANDIAVAKAQLTNDHLAKFGAEGTDNKGRTLDQKLLQYDIDNPILPPEIQERLRKTVGVKGVKGDKTGKGGANARNTITAGSKNIDQLKIYFPDLNIKEGDKFEVRYKRGKDGKQIPIFIPMQ